MNFEQNDDNGNEIEIPQIDPESLKILGFLPGEKKRFFSLIHQYSDNKAMQLKITSEIEEAFQANGNNPKILREYLNIFENKDIHDLILFQEERLSGNEAHLISRFGEQLRKEGEVDKELPAIKEMSELYKDAPMFLHFWLGRSLGIGYWDNKVFFDDLLEDKKLGIVDTKYKFYTNEQIREKLLKKYNQIYFFLPDLKNIILNNEKEKFLDYPRVVSSTLEKTLNENPEDINSTLESLDTFIESHERGDGWQFNLLVDDAVRLNLINQEEGQEFLKQVKEIVQQVKLGVERSEDVEDLYHYCSGQYKKFLEENYNYNSQV